MIQQKTADDTVRAPLRRLRVPANQWCLTSATAVRTLSCGVTFPPRLPGALRSAWFPMRRRQPFLEGESMTALIRPAASGDTANGDAANGGSLDLVNEIRRLLRESDEPLTAAKSRDRLPAPLNQISLDSLAEVLKRQA